MRGPRAARLKHPCDNPSWETSSTARCAYSRHASKQPSWQPTYRRLQEHGRAPSQRRPEPRVAPRESKCRYCTHRPSAQEHYQTGNIANCRPARLKAPTIHHCCMRRLPLNSLHPLRKAAPSHAVLPPIRSAPHIRAHNSLAPPKPLASQAHVQAQPEPAKGRLAHCQNARDTCAVNPCGHIICPRVEAFGA